MKPSKEFTAGFAVLSVFWTVSVVIMTFGAMGTVIPSDPAQHAFLVPMAALLMLFGGASLALVPLRWIWSYVTED